MEETVAKKVNILSYKGLCFVSDKVTVRIKNFSQKRLQDIYIFLKSFQNSNIVQCIIKSGMT